MLMTDSRSSECAPGLSSRGGENLITSAAAASARVPFATVARVDEEIEQAARALAEAAGSPVRVILFGSHARGDARPGSDLDFLVIRPHVSDRHAEMVRLRGVLHDLLRPIDVLVYSEADVEEWGEAPGTAIHAALTEGRVLLEACADDLTRRART